MSEAGQILDNAQKPNTPDITNLGGATKDGQPSPALPKEEPVSSKLAVLMERERQAVTRERLAKTQEEKLRDRLKKIEEFEALQKDPTKVDDLLKHLGWDYDRLTQSKLQDGQVPPQVLIQQLNDKISDLENRLKQEKDVEAEARKKQTLESETKAVTDFKSEISDYLKNNQARYELTDFEQAGDLIFDVIDEHYNRTVDPDTGVGKIMPIAEACDKVEEHLEKKYLAAKEKNKVKAFWNNMPKGVQEQIKKQETAQDRPSKLTTTLTNNLGPKTSERPHRPPEEKRIQQILADFMAKQRSQYAG
jgi:vacuolar-type H+-ATPase subunit I/STV1